MEFSRAMLAAIQFLWVNACLKLIPKLAEMFEVQRILPDVTFQILVFEVIENTVCEGF